LIDRLDSRFDLFIPSSLAIVLRVSSGTDEQDFRQLQPLAGREVESLFGDCFKTEGYGMRFF